MELKLFFPICIFLQVMGAILPSKDWYKKVYFLTELDRKASVSMVPYSKCYSPATASTKDFQVMQLESSIQSEVHVCLHYTVY